MPSPLSNFRAPVVRGGVGRDVSIPWTSRDDALLLIGVYKHGYRAFEEIRDDAELAFSCQRTGMPPLPAPLAPPDQPPAPNGGGVMGHPVSDACFEPQDRLPLPAAWAAGPRRRAVAPPPPPKGEHAPCFLNERDFRERVKALIDVLGEQACMHVCMRVWRERTFAHVTCAYAHVWTGRAGARPRGAGRVEDRVGGGDAVRRRLEREVISIGVSSRVWTRTWIGAEASPGCIVGGQSASRLAGCI